MVTVALQLYSHIQVLLSKYILYSYMYVNNVDTCSFVNKSNIVHYFPFFFLQWITVDHITISMSFVESKVNRLENQPFAS